MRSSTVFLAAALLAAPPAALAESAQLREGRAAYAENCAACHGPTGRGGSGYANPIWGAGAQIRKFRTAMGMWEYNRDLMPFDDPNRVSDELKWAVTLYILVNHGAAPAETTLGPQNARQVPIP
jgi:S-disulfanyl-L-cysteine oxidoreductase SoxD